MKQMDQKEAVYKAEKYPPQIFNDRTGFTLVSDEKIRNAAQAFLNSEPTLEKIRQAEQKHAAAKSDLACAEIKVAQLQRELKDAGIENQRLLDLINNSANVTSNENPYKNSWKPEAHDLDCECDDHDHHDYVALTPYQREIPKIGRNDPCYCGSGKKYKKCCAG